MSKNGREAAPRGPTNKLAIPRLPSFKDFPVNPIAIQTLYYSMVAFYGSYLTLYFGSIGFSKTQIGLITSISTLAVFLTQPLWGQASDRAKDGRTVLSILFVACGVLIFGYYFTTDYIPVLIIASVYAMFYNAIAPNMDSLTLESFEKSPGRFHYGHARVGGTIGYSIMVLVAGRVFSVSYTHMFYMTSILCFAMLFFVRKASSVKARGKRGPISLKALIANKKILCFMFINLIQAFGMLGFYTFYPLHFVERIGSESMFGVILFVTAMSELPFWFISGKIAKRFGRERLMVIAISVFGARWIALYFLTNFPLLLAVNLVHGFCYATINYCIVTYINDEVPHELRATGQTMNNLSAMVVSRIIGGAVIGALSDAFGVGSMFVFLAVLSFAGAAVFYIWIKALDKAPIGNP